MQLSLAKQVEQLRAELLTASSSVGSRVDDQVTTAQSNTSTDVALAVELAVLRSQMKSLQANNKLEKSVRANNKKVPLVKIIIWTSNNFTFYSQAWVAEQQSLKAHIAELRAELSTTRTAAAGSSGSSPTTAGVLGKRPRADFELHSSKKQWCGLTRWWVSDALISLCLCCITYYSSTQDEQLITNALLEAEHFCSACAMGVSRQQYLHRKEQLQRSGHEEEWWQCECKSTFWVCVLYVVSIKQPTFSILALCLQVKVVSRNQQSLPTDKKYKQNLSTPQAKVDSFPKPHNFTI